MTLSESGGASADDRAFYCRGEVAGLALCPPWVWPPRNPGVNPDVIRQPGDPTARCLSDAYSVCDLIRPITNTSPTHHSGLTSLYCNGNGLRHDSWTHSECGGLSTVSVPQRVLVCSTLGGPDLTERELRVGEWASGFCGPHQPVTTHHGSQCCEDTEMIAA